ncbi:MAG TPA: tRNA (guanosine(37)-N1)-methyltransferase TrmD [Rickettsiales bacterium]|nr:tRNA (guanosine(37)-N1)-methyltransferase TrmD [Rickettsiales bacterium]
MISFKIFTLFEELFPGPLGASITGLALKNGLWDFKTINIRNYAKNTHKTVDDIPYGGGAGMVLKPDVIADALTANISQKTKIFYLSPRGKVFTQKIAQELAQEKEIALLCGRYEGIDQRVIDEFQIEEISIGDYILSGGEIATYVVIDAVLRNCRGVLGKEDSLKEESFSMQESPFLLEYPHYTHPASWRGRDVPEILTSGHHKKINDWRLKKSLEITKKNRHDLYEKYLKDKNL